ncbi:ciliary neurotrophic factor [Xiphias gladius]|uniref:ciliary neurotrophic factor n=1 Tax=Xiphias gladius TaxID=8245 RepID=UPI001A9943F1|nr:ciliary neurotrophic factor [Xiphias gladius]XP_040001604.1 ciliary neurotrophic factor [Xiphias gladius]
MADRRTRSMAGSDLSRTTAARATAIAEQLHHECSILLELYRKKENFSADVTVADGRLVSVPPPSSQLDTRDKLWRLHSALLQCRSLLERAIAKEEEDLGGGKKGDYETQRKMVKERLSLLLINTGELLKAVDGTAVLTPNLEGLELDGPTHLFELKLWVYRIFKEVDYWTKTAITTLQSLPSVNARERARTTRVRSTRSAR